LDHELCRGEISVSTMWPVQVVFDPPILDQYPCFEQRVEMPQVHLPIVATTRRPAVAVVATMLAIAFWHEFSFRYLAWALWNAAALVVHRWFSQRCTDRETGTYAPSWLPPSVRRIAAASLTVGFVALSFTIARSSSLTTGLEELAIIFTGS